MTDYNHRPPNQDSSFSRPLAPMDSIRRSLTRGSYYSHASASTKSWVQSTQQNPPPPPEEVEDEEEEPSFSPVRTPRPLPQPQLRPQTLHTINATEPPDEDEDEYMNIDPDVSGMDFGYLNEGLGRGRTFGNSPDAEMEPPRKERSFVGGFVRGIRRLPRKMLGYGVSNEKRRFFRRGTFGTEVTGTSVTGMTAGNTLPVYKSNPSTPVAGPSNVQYLQAMEMPFAQPHPQEGIPHSLLSGAALRRAQPNFRVTPPSESIIHEEVAQIFQSPQPQYAEVVHPETSPTDNAERTTVMVYQDTADSTVEGPMQRVPSRSPRSPRNSNTPARTPSITIQATPVPVRPQQLQQEPPINPEPMVQSPATEHPLPTADYLKMGAMSPSRTSRNTMMTSTSLYDPSFASNLSPIERFFKTLYHLPWISHGRITIDYRPDTSLQGNRKRKGLVKKPMASWYHSIMSKSKNGSLDLLSNGTPATTPRTSTGTNLTPFGSPTSNRTRRSSTSDRHHHHHTRHHHHRRHHRRRATMSTMTEEEPTRSDSPLVPAVYPYSYPAYPYTYPGYAAMPPALQSPPGQIPMQAQVATSPIGQPAVGAFPVAPGGGSHSKRSPRGPRTRRTPTYPHGYTAYQPMAFPPPAPAPPPPIYLIQSSPTLSHPSIEGATPPQPSQAQLVSPYYMPIQFIPGGFNNDSTMPSPPSSPTPRPAAAAPTSGQ